MELHFEAVLDQRYQRVERALRSDARSWLPGSPRSGDRLLVELVTPAGDGRLRRVVAVQLDSPEPSLAGVVLGIRWQAAEQPDRHPTFTGLLMMEPLANGRTRARLSSDYRPPLGPADGLADWAVLHRNAHAAVRDFFDRLCFQLERAAASLGGRPTVD
jgi:hypothetical protein